MPVYVTRYPFDPTEALEDEKIPKQRLMTGTKENSIVIDATSKGLVFNAFFTENNGQKYAVIRKPVRIKWEDLEKIKEDVIASSSKKRKVKKTGADFHDTPTKEYLETLPIVTLNGLKYYYDGERKERRPVDKPNAVYCYKDDI